MTAGGSTGTGRMGDREERDLLEVADSMGRPDDVAALLIRGLEPKQIASETGLSIPSVLDYLERAVGKGLVRRSDVYFSLRRDVRRDPTTPEEHEVVRRFGSASHALGDMYEDLYELETTLHARIRAKLEKHHGEGKQGWWLRVPITTRHKCNQRCEEDENRLDAYRYTDLMDLWSILDANWETLQAEVGGYRADKPHLKTALRRLNEIRRVVMHPTRGERPSEVDFQFIREFKRHARLSSESPSSP
jgi:hypothetical protein